MKSEKKMFRVTPRGVWHIKAKGYLLSMCWRRVPGAADVVRLQPDVFGRICQICAAKVDKQ